MSVKLTRIVVAALLTSSYCHPAFAASSYKLTKGKVQSITVESKKVLCGAPSSKWVPVKKVAGTTYAAFKKASAAHKAACSNIIPRASLKSLSQLPDVSEMTKATESASQLAGGLNAMAVIGEAPVIPSVPSMDPTQLFWRAGVIDSIIAGSPTEEQCGEFWGGHNDGESAGQTACYMLQDVGYSIGDIQQAGTSLCYFKKIPASTAFSSGAAHITKGSAPTGGIRKLFDTPEGSKSRIMKVSIGQGQGTAMYIKVASRSELDAAGNLYRFDLWDCEGSQITSRETGVVKLSGDFISSHYNKKEDEGVSGGVVRGFLKFEEGDITFDSSRERVASSTADRSGELWASEIRVTADNQIISKQRAISATENRKSYAVSNFSGSSLADLRFLSGATTMSFVRNDQTNAFVGSAEYRNTGYVSAPDSSESAVVNAFSFDDDSFYSGDIEAPTLSSSGISCSPKVDIEMTLDMEAEDMATIRNECEGSRLDGFDMCRNDSVQQAAEAYQTYCFAPPT